MSQLIHSHPHLPHLDARRVMAFAALLLVVCAALAFTLVVESDDPAPAPVPAISDVVGDASAGVRYDGGPDEGSRLRRSAAPIVSGIRYDGGPEEGSAAVR